MNLYKTIEIPPFENKNIVPGDVLRSYKCGFNESKPYKFQYIEGVVLKVESWITENDYYVVKWKFQVFGNLIYKVDCFGSDTFTISKGTPFLFKVNKHQLELPL